MNPEDYCVVPFHEGDDVADFDCGNEDLNEFLTTEEVVNYKREWAGHTFLVRKSSDWDLVGYYTVAPDGLEIPDDWVKKSMVNHLGIKRIGALLLGRLAVALPHQGTGVGSMMLKHIFTAELDTGRPARVVRLTCYPDRLAWYRSRGFSFISEKEQEKAVKGAEKIRLFFDLQAIPNPNVRIPKAEA